MDITTVAMIALAVLILYLFARMASGKQGGIKGVKLMKGQSWWIHNEPPTFKDLQWVQAASENEYGEGIMERPDGEYVWPNPKAKFIPWGKCAQLIFKNGFGISVIRTYGSYGGDQGQYEAAVLRKRTLEEYDRESARWDTNRETNWYVITYDTDAMPIDVRGYLEEDEVVEYMIRVWGMDKKGRERSLTAGEKQR